MSLLQQITDAQNAHDAVAMAACFAEDYQSAQPVHPGRDFRGRAQVLANWTAVFEGVPDFHAELLGFCSQTRPSGARWPGPEAIATARPSPCAASSSSSGGTG